jgi:ankyrin repeat protein
MHYLASSSWTRERCILGVLLERVESKDSALALPLKNGLVPIFHAAQADSSAAVMLLLSQTSHIPLSPKGWSLAHYGVRMNSVKVLQALLERGEPLDGRTEDGSTALHFIQKDGEPGLVRLLTAAGIELASLDSNGNTPLHKLVYDNISIDFEVVNLLATRDSVNMVNKDGFTALHYAANFQNDGYSSLYFRKRKQCIETLIANGADLAARDPSGRSSLQILLDQATKAWDDFGMVDNAYLTDMIIEIVEKITDESMLYEPSQGITPLAWAFREGKESLMTKLVAEGLDVDVRNGKRKWSALDYACKYGCSRDLFRQMLQSSHQLDEPNGDGQYLTHMICSRESEADSFLLQELFEAGVNLNSWSVEVPPRMTPMMCAASNGKLEHLTQ